MSARHKLNAATLNGILLLSAVSGVLLQSWTVFWVAAGLFTLVALASGGIRPNPRRRR